MGTDNGLKKLLTLAGIAALLVLPVVVIVKKCSEGREDTRKRTDDDECSIFAADLEE